MCVLCVCIYVFCVRVLCMQYMGWTFIINRLTEIQLCTHLIAGVHVCRGNMKLTGTCVCFPLYMYMYMYMVHVHVGCWLFESCEQTRGQPAFPLEGKSVCHAGAREASLY